MGTRFVKKSSKMALTRQQWQHGSIPQQKLTLPQLRTGYAQVVAKKRRTEEEEEAQSRRRSSLPGGWPRRQDAQRRRRLPGRRKRRHSLKNEQRSQFCVAWTHGFSNILSICVLHSFCQIGSLHCG